MKLGQEFKTALSQSKDYNEDYVIESFFIPKAIEIANNHAKMFGEFILKQVLGLEELSEGQKTRIEYDLEIYNQQNNLKQ